MNCWFLGYPISEPTHMCVIRSSFGMEVDCWNWPSFLDALQQCSQSQRVLPLPSPLSLSIPPHVPCGGTTWLYFSCFVSSTAWKIRSSGAPSPVGPKDWPFPYLTPKYPVQKDRGLGLEVNGQCIATEFDHLHKAKDTSDTKVTQGDTSYGKGAGKKVL